MPKLSVIIPAFNHEKFIGAAISSVLNQSIADLELIIIDDGSQDGTFAQIRGVKDSRIRLLQQGNQGAHAALNRGLHLATGQYLSILNSDDVFTIDRLAVLVDHMEANPHIGLVGTYIDMIDEHGIRQETKQGYKNFPPWPLPYPERSFRAREDLVGALMTENYYATTSNFFFRNSVWEKTGDFLPLRYVHDWDFALRVARNFEIDLLSIPLLQYRLHTHNTIRKDRVAMIFEILWLLAVHLPQFKHKQLEPLLYSLYTFGVESVLTSLLIEGISQDQERALSLLKADNPARITYLDYIAKNSSIEQESRNRTHKVGDMVQRVRSIFSPFTT